MANVEDTPAVAPATVADINAVVEAKDDAIKEEIPAEVCENEDKSQNHKCSIAIMLNDDPVTPPRNRNEEDNLSKEDVTVNSNSNEI